MAERRPGGVFVIPCDKCQELAGLIEKHPGNDLELVNLAKELRRHTKGFFKMCAFYDDCVLWEGGPDIRDFQMFDRDKRLVVMTPEGTFDNGVPAKP